MPLQNPQNTDQVPQSWQEAAIMVRSQMVPGGHQYSIDEIVQETGAPPDVVARLLNQAQGRPTAQTGTDGGITAAAGPQSNQDMTDITNQGNAVMNRNAATNGNAAGSQSISNIVTGGNATSVDQEVESETLDFMEAIDIENLDPEDERTLAQKIAAANVAGTIAAGELDQDSVSSLSTANEILKQYGLDPEGQKAQMEIYREAANDFYDPAYKDIKGAVPLPDQALPYLVAGAALIQSGEKGDSWGTALSNAFLRYGVASKQEDKAYRDKLASLDIDKAKGITNFMGNVYLANIKDRKTLERSLVLGRRMPYKIPGSNVPKMLLDAELNLPQYKGATAWQAAIKPYAIFADANKDGIPDPKDGAIFKLLPQSQAQFLTEQGFIVNPDYKVATENDWYIVDGVQKYWNKAEMDQYKSANPDATIRKLPALKQVAALNNTSGQLEFIPVEWTIGGPNGGPMPGKGHFTPIDDSMSATFDSQGNLTFFKGQGALATGVLSPAQIYKESSRIQGRIEEIQGPFTQLLGTLERTLDVVDTARAQGAPVMFGLSGTGTVLGRRIIKQFEQANEILRRRDSGITYFIDANNNGKRDPNEGVSYEQMGEQFADKFRGSNLGEFLDKSGLSKERLENMMFTLAIQVAGTFNMKGRDISDKDIERFLRLSGKYASDEEGFRALLMDLAGSTIAQRDSNIFELSRNDFSQILKSGEKEKIADDPDYEPEYGKLTDRFFPDGPGNFREDQLMVPKTGTLTLADWRTKVKEYQDSAQAGYLGGPDVPVETIRTIPLRKFTTTFKGETITLAGGDPSGDGSKTLHDKWIELVNLSPDDEAAEVIRIRKNNPKLWEKLQIYDNFQQRSGNYTSRPMLKE